MSANPKSLRRDFASLVTFVEAAQGRSELSRGERKSQIEGNEEFRGTRSFSEAVTLAFGWREGAERIERERLALAPKSARVRKVAAMREVGPGTISMGNFLAGHPQPYVVLNDTATPRAGKGKVVRLLVNIGSSATVPAEVIERRGGAILALVDALERAGRRVEITTVHVTTGGVTAKAVQENRKPGGPRLDYRVAVKRADDKLNLYTLAFALAHPSMQRRISFAVKECEASDIRARYNIGPVRNYGTSCDVEPEAGVVYLKSMFVNPLTKRLSETAWLNDDNARAWVREQCEAQGVKFA